MKIISVVGARPQFIKAAVVSHALAQATGVKEFLLHTGQHYDAAMSNVFFEELNIPTPCWSLNVQSGNHGAQTGRMLEGIEGVLMSERPDMVLVYGDTNSTLAGALAAGKLGLPLVHVEAGLRSFNWAMPEEINRVLTDRLADLLLAPSQVAVEHLYREGIDPARVHVVGDVMYDAALQFRPKVGQRSELVQRLGVEPGEFILATIHRAENTDDPIRLSAICEGFLQAASLVPIVLPLHPRTGGALNRFGLFDHLRSRVHVIEPLGYLDMLALEQAARLIVTDSGGVQKEAYYNRVPCVTLRHETEWVELVETGWNRLVPPTNADAIAAALVLQPNQGRPVELYGGGGAAQKVADMVAAF